MYSNLGVQRYRETDISSMSSEKMIVLLYERVVTDLESARKALIEKNRSEFAKQINHSQRIISELRGALDHSIGGEISQNLESLYSFMFHEHLEILLDHKAVHIDNCLKVISPLLEAWRQIPTGTGAKAAHEKARPSTGPKSASENSESAPQSGQGSESAGAPGRPQTSLLSVSA
jgi:flagellar protein FliS